MANPRDVLTRHAPAGVTQAYGNETDQVVEVFVPRGDNLATIVFLHGGFWRAAYDRAHVRPLCNMLANSGFGVISVEYRRTSNGGGWPHTFDDVAAALVFTDEVIAQYGLATNIILSGHSAGGHLALWAATLPRRPETQLCGVVALAPICDLAECYNRGLDDNAAALLMDGGPLEQPQRYELADPMVHELDVPVTLIHGDQDARVPIDFAIHYAQTHSAVLHKLSGIEHFGLIDPLSKAWPSLLTAYTNMSQIRRQDSF